MNSFFHNKNGNGKLIRHSHGASVTEFHKVT